MIDFSTVKEWKIPYNGSLADVIKVTDTNNTRVIWEKMSGLYEPFYVENTTNSTKTLTISQKHFTTASEYNNITVEYSTNKTNWSTLGTTSVDLTYDIPANSKIYLRANTNAWCLFNTSSRPYHTITGMSSVGGNILSLLYGSNFVNQTTFPSNLAGCLAYLFMGNQTIFTDASKLLLPCDTLYEYCYTLMFANCGVLTAAPALPATILAQGCYANMFANCAALTTAPDLLTRTLVTQCYSNMFSGCSSLRNVKCLGYNPDTTAYYTQLWLLDVSSTGTFIKASDAVWPRDASGIPSGWTVVNQ